jgi:hypothetical protein
MKYDIQPQQFIYLILMNIDIDGYGYVNQAVMKVIIKTTKPHAAPRSSALGWNKYLVAPRVWARAKQLPRAMMPAHDMKKAAIEPATTPAMPKPTNLRQSPEATTTNTPAKIYRVASSTLSQSTSSSFSPIDELSSFALSPVLLATSLSALWPCQMLQKGCLIDCLWRRGNQLMTEKKLALLVLVSQWCLLALAPPWRARPQVVNSIRQGLTLPAGWSRWR